MAFLLALTGADAHAHQVWIEQDTQSAQLYFGEFNLNLCKAPPAARTH
jgi:hypothetical protein